MKMFAKELRTEYRENPTGLHIRQPLLSWKCEDGIRQSAYQIVLSDGDKILWDSGMVKTDKTSVICPEKIPYRTSVVWKVRLWDEENEQGEWSPDAFFETGIGSGDEWKGNWITPEITKLTEENYDCDDAINAPARAAWKEKEGNKAYMPHQPAGYMRKVFAAEPGQKNRLYITSQGLYEAYINGKRVGDYVLTPGCSNYTFEMPYQTYDISGLLREGENEILVILGDGWYRSTSGVDGDRNLYGDTLALLCQLEIDGKVILCTDESWEASQEGPLRQNDMQQGEVYDARMSCSCWHGVKEISQRKDILTAMDTCPIREQEEFRGEIITTPKGETVIDFGQNLAGYVEMEITGKSGEEIRLLHGETLDQEGSFTQENFEDWKRHKENGTYQMISYICKDGRNHYKPRFTIMGFRYVKVETTLDLSDAVFIAHAVYSDMKQTAWFECSNPDVNRLFENSVWSQKGNFCDVPTDCPTRERAGWTGDAGLYAETGLMLMDSYSVYRKWLAQCRYGQYEDGRVANIAPPNKKPGFMTGMLSGSVGWGDASIIVPYEMYLRSGDIRILRENYPMMKKWYDFLEKRAKKTGWKEWFKRNPYKRYTMSSGLNYGEWCEPGSNPAQAMRNGNYDVATAYFAYSGVLLSEIAEILGEKKEAEHYKNTAKKAKKAFYYNYTEKGEIHSKRQCQYIRPIQFGLLSSEECKKAARQLDGLVADNDYHLNTGFLTTPVLCKTLADYGYIETAYRVLLQDTAPGWLYEVKNGATTLWETWEGNASLNHYSYGAVSGWLISGVCGIRYRQGRIRIAPVPHPLLHHAEAVYDSPAGKIKSSWKYEGNDWMLSVEIPSNAEAEICLPDGETYQVHAGKYEYKIRG